MHISGRFNNVEKVDIANTKVDIEYRKVNIETKLKKYSINISNKTLNHTFLLFSNFRNSIFGRNLVEQSTGLKSSQASKLIKLLLDSNIIEPVKGHGKGKYRFIDFFYIKNLIYLQKLIFSNFFCNELQKVNCK